MKKYMLGMGIILVVVSQNIQKAWAVSQIQSYGLEAFGPTPDNAAFPLWLENAKMAAHINHVAYGDLAQGGPGLFISFNYNTIYDPVGMVQNMMVTPNVNSWPFSIR